MSVLPLLTHASLDAPLAYRGGRALRVAEFLRDVYWLSERLPTNSVHVLNVCVDRYRFAVGLAAALLTGKISLLPGTHTPAVICQLRDFAADVFCLTDDPRCPIALPQVLYADSDFAAPAGAPGREIPQIDADQTVAYVFTSGTTGLPVPHRKTWSRLVHCVRAGATRLGLTGTSGHALLATVPPQHMYGFESSVLLAFQGGHALCAQRPFYPADICAALAALPRPRVLISTPIHLRALLAAQPPWPALDLIVSATAPLSQNLARDVEQQFHAPLQEIYGSTETGQIATRRTAQEIEWQLWPEVSLQSKDGRTIASGGHVEQPIALADVVECTDLGRFLLHGRTADLVNIAGKRSSIGYLNHHLNAIAGVIDGVFFVRDQAQGSADTGVARLGAVVVAPQLDAATLIGALRERIDPVFLPRPLLFVPDLKRNSTGKLTQEMLEILISAHCGNTSVCRMPARAADDFCIAADHPALAGHFPDNPVVPGVLLLDEALYRISRLTAVSATCWHLRVVKFRSPLRPGEPLRFDHEMLADGNVCFTFRAADRVIVDGTFARA